MTKATGIKPFKRWLEKEVDKAEKEEDRISNMEFGKCCDNHSAHEEAVRARRNALVDVWNHFIQQVKLQ